METDEQTLESEREQATTTCSNEQIVNTQKAMENGFHSMASFMGSIIQQAFSSWEENILGDDELESEIGDQEPPPKQQETEVSMESLIREKSSQNNKKISNEVSQGRYSREYKTRPQFGRGW